MPSATSASLLAALKSTQSEDTHLKGAVAAEPLSRLLQHLTSGSEATEHPNLCIGGMNQPRPRFAPGRLYPLIPGRLSFTAHENQEHTIQEIQSNPKLFFFSTDLQESYVPFCSDFGPTNLASLIVFCDYVLEKEQDPRLSRRHMVYYFNNDVESASNAAFLLAAYVMLEHGFTPEEAIEPFTNVSGIPIMPFRDPTFVKSTFPLSILDCLRGLKKAVDLKWFDLDEFDLETYEKLECPENGDMHQICPKFVAFRGPEQCVLQRKDSGACSPELVISRFKSLGIAKVIRLNEPDAYNRQVFLDAGMDHVDLEFADCTCPSDELVAHFFDECEAEQGVVAVHCLAGLGRTGTMIGLWLMSKFGFTAREAIAWMRIVRPGSVIGPQQHYLEWMEQRLRDGSFPSSSELLSQLRIQHIQPAFGFDAPPASLSEELAAQVRNAIAHHHDASD